MGRPSVVRRLQPILSLVNWFGAARDKSYIRAKRPLPSSRLSRYLPQRRVLVLAAAALLSLLASLAFGPVVRSLARSWGERRGITIEIQSAWPTLGGIRLSGVHVSAPDWDAADAQLENVVVGFNATLHPRYVEVRSGRVNLRGEADALVRKFRNRTPKATPDRARSGGAGLDCLVDALDVRWEGAMGGADVTTVQGIRLERKKDAGTFGAARMEWSTPHASLIARGLTGTFERTQTQSEHVRLTALALQALEATLTGSDATAPRAPAPMAAMVPMAARTKNAGAVGADAPRSDLAEHGGRNKHSGRGKAKGASASDAESSENLARGGAGGDDGIGFAWLRRLGALRARLISAVARSADFVAPNAAIAVDGVHLSFRQKTSALNVGPGSIRARREGDVLALDAQAGGGERNSSLNLHARVPIAPQPGRDGVKSATETGATGPVSIELEGGPVTLAALGVHENDFGLLDVDKASVDARATLTFAPDGSSVAFDGSGQLASLSIDDRRLAEQPVRGLEVLWKAKGSAALDGSRLEVESGELALGATHLRARGVVEAAPDAVRLDATVKIPSVECQKMLDSLPRGLVPKLVDLRIGGVFALDGHLAIDTRKPEDADIDWKLANGCRIVSAPPDVDVVRFSQPFRHEVYDPDGQKVELMSGPGTPDWVPLSQMSRYLEVAVTTTEDGGFWHHGGFDKGAIRSSIRDDLRAGKFLRGASTISMQLAKNLYLEREKSLSRKLQEAFLTMYLEQELTKDEILELYFNVVEFGPMIYGIGPAADYYFHTVPSELTLSQALFLTSILPSPKRQYFGEGGRLSKGYMAYLHRVMQIMFERNSIDERELAEGLSEIPVFGQPKPDHADGTTNGESSGPAAAVSVPAGVTSDEP